MPFTCLPIRWMFAWLLVVATTGAALADSPWPKVVYRQTDDPDLDLVNALIRRQRFDEAAQFCASEQNRFEPSSNAAAKWAIRHSNVLSKQQMTAEIFDEAAVALAQKPVTDLLKTNPDHRRRLFLKAQSVAVQQDAAKHDVVIAAISLSNTQRVDAAFARLLRATTVMSEFVTESREAQSDLNVRKTDLEEKSLSRDLLRLQHESQIDVVSMALMQTDLFARGSRDQSTAANKAERLADSTLQSLPVNSRARLEIARLRVESILRGGATERAETNLAELLREVGKPIPPRIQAMMVNIDLAIGRVSQAGRRINAFYANQPTTVSIEMDLVKLDWLIRQGDAAVSDWLDSIERRHGAYARRRAEAISLSNIKSGSGSTASTGNLDPSIVAAQGKEWLRRDNPVRAGELLSAAARAESNPSRAITRASEAAAALVKAKRSKDAATIMAEIAIKNSTAQSASAAHLQASVLLAKAKVPDAANQIESLLLQTSETWPKSDSAAKAQTWLLEILKRQKRDLDAAEIATAFLKHNAEAQKVDEAMQHWIRIATESDPETATIVLQKFDVAFRTLQENPVISERYIPTAIYLVDMASLGNLPTAFTAENQTDKFAGELLDFRRGNTTTLAKAPESQLAATRWRLMRDGDQDPKTRRKIAALLKKWGSDSLQDEATILIWNGEIDQAVERISKVASGSNNAGEIWRDFAKTLTSAGSPACRTEAIKIWDRLANGLPKGSQAWHDAKLATIDLLVLQGEKQESMRRAKYILLTNAPQEPNLLQRYESASQP